MLAKIKFSDSIYQIDILPAENENGQFYEMLMAPELDSKVLDDDGFDGQITLGEDTFYQKYEQQILRLTEKFMPPKDEDAKSLSQHRQQMEQYVDYRNYLTFSMYERVEDEDGNVKKNAVDDMAGRSLPALRKRTGITVDRVRTGRAAAVLDPKCGQCVRI